MHETWNGKRALLVGMQRSGKAAAELLLSLGAQAVLNDTKEEIDGLLSLFEKGCVNGLGQPAASLLPGCDALILSPAVPPDAEVIRQATACGIPIYSELGFAAGLAKGEQIAITGTNGKTTTCALTGEILKNAGKNTYVAGNIGLPLSQVAQKSSPEDYLVIEVSSFQLEHMEDFHPRGAALLNLTPDHLNRHGTMEAYGALKEGMIRQQGAGDFFIYNADDPFCRNVAARAKGETIPFSRTQKLKKGAWVENGQVMAFGRALCQTEEVGIKGPHNLENALAASAIATMLELPAPVIRHSLRTFQGVPHRMEHVGTLGGVTFINDSKGTNPESSARAVESMLGPTALIAGGDEKEMGFDAYVDAIVKSPHIKKVILIGKTAAQLEEALQKAGYTAYIHAGFDFEKAIALAYEGVREGGTVLLSPACASFDMFKDFEDRGDTFRRIVLGAS